MKKTFTTLFLLAFISMIACLPTGTATAQTTLYSTDFGTSNAFPPGWTASGGTTLWTDNSTSPSSGYAGASGGDNADNGTSGTAMLIFNNGLSTAVYSGIVVTWGGRMTSTGASPTFQWSIDGTNWNTVSFTDVSNNSTWGLVTVNLPSGASGVSNLEFRWTSNSAAGTYRMDDFTVKGTSTTGAQGPTGPTGATGPTGRNGSNRNYRSYRLRICRLNFCYLFHYRNRFKNIYYQFGINSNCFYGRKPCKSGLFHNAIRLYGRLNYCIYFNFVNS